MRHHIRRGLTTTPATLIIAATSILCGGNIRVSCCCNDHMTLKSYLYELTYLNYFSPFFSFSSISQFVSGRADTLRQVNASNDNILNIIDDSLAVSLYMDTNIKVVYMSYKFCSKHFILLIAINNIANI